MKMATYITKYNSANYTNTLDVFDCEFVYCADLPTNSCTGDQEVFVLNRDAFRSRANGVVYLVIGPLFLTANLLCIVTLSSKSLRSLVCYRILLVMSVVSVN